MYRFWKDIIKPCFEMAGVKSIVEIGSDKGYNTDNLVEYCKQNNGMLYIVDPAPQIDINEKYKEYIGFFEYRKELSLDALEVLRDYDCILLDGDHNWYTVYNELMLVRKKCSKFPLVLLHDIGWPYSRRDLYYNPDNIPEQFINPYEKKAIALGSSALSDVGINGHLFNAVDEGTPKNGVLTAIEDFLGENPELEFDMLDCISGLGIIKPKNKFDDVFKHINNGSVLKNFLKAVENQRLIEFIGRVEYLNKYKAVNSEYKALKEKYNILSSNYSDLQKKCTALQEEYDNSRKVKIERDSLKAQSEYYKKETEIFKNSLRYKTGSAFYDAKGSLKSFAVLPYTLLKLYRESKVENRTISDGGENSGGVPKRINTRRKEPVKIITPSLYNKEQIIEMNKKRLAGNSAQLGGEPLVSIIILNRNGLKNLKILFNSLLSVKFYKNFEIILVDNKSSDKSLEYIESLKGSLNIQIIRNSTNESFSAANNKGAQQAKGEYLLFLNNDIEVTEGWLDELLLTAINNPKCGAVGAKLVYPLIPDSSINKGKSFKLQHTGIAFSESYFEDKLFIKPYNIDNGEEAFSSIEEKTVRRSAVTAAVLLLRRSIFDEVGGFDTDFIYGYEDVDLCLKVQRKGYYNYYCPTSLLFHYEFGTQVNSESEAVIARRTNNIKVFKGKWQEYLKTNMWLDRLNGTFDFEEKPLTVAFVVTEADDNTTAGDYFTAMEFGTALQRRGCKIKYLARRSENDWYDVGEDTDVLISLLEAYDVSKIYNITEHLVTIAWARNWFDRWCEKPYINEYSMIFASSETACRFMKTNLNREVDLFPIATNHLRFAGQTAEDNSSKKDRFSSDIAFTGSYWNDPREVIDIINPDSLPYELKIFGSNWSKIEKFKKNDCGFVKYCEMPDVYKYTKIVIDDANRVTKPYGAVNSRVFDALAAGRLVVTNGTIGADETFCGMLPSFSSREEFESKIKYYMENSDAYNEKVEQLRKFVLENHTYEVRAGQIIELLKGKCLPNNKKIAIMTPVPKWEECNSWGDYHFAVAMKKCFEKKGFETEIRILPEWEKAFDGRYVIVLRGLSEYRPKNNYVNIMWNISHPDKVTIDEYNSYDAVYISSEKWAEQIKQQSNTHVEALLQCTDPDVFFVNGDGQNKQHDILFVGNSRKIFRKIIKDLLPTKYDLSVYGTFWDNFIDKKYIKGESIPNNELGKVYNSSKILLNDHWDDMREKGFVSNRLFDGLAAGAFIISDEMDEIKECFGDSVVVYKDKKDLQEKVEFYINNPQEREKLVSKGQKLVIEKHTFENRMDVISRFIEEN